MKINKINLGKVSITIDKEPWDINKDYDRLTIVELENAYCTYISRKPVPSGIDIENTEYWMLFSKYSKTYNSNEGVFNMSKYLTLKNEEDSFVKLTLEQAVTNAPLVIKNAGQIITFLDKNNVWQRYQYQWYDVANWNSLLKWKNLNDINSKPIDDESALIYNISDYIPGGSKYGQPIYPGIYTIYGTTTPVSQYRVIGGYDDSLGEVSFPLQLDETIVIKEIEYSVGIRDTYYLFVGNSIDGYGYQTTLYSDEDEIPAYIPAAFGDDGAYVLVNINRLENKINGKLDNKVDKEQGKALSTNDFTNENVSELANSIVGATYNSNTKKLVFTKNNNGTVEVDATPFIKDGMVDSVTIDNGYLVITFNTDSGKETIRIALTAIFNPNNYYNKTQIDDFLGNKANTTDLAEVATSGSYNSLSDRPTIPTIPTNVSAFNNDAGYISASDIANKEDKMEIVEVPSGSTTLTAEIGKYYVFAGTVGTMAITLPTPTDTTKVKSIGFYMTTGANTNVTFSNGGTTVKKYDGFVIDSNKTVEVNGLFNGSNWVMAYAVIE